jgi:hypothetical protein
MAKLRQRAMVGGHAVVTVVPAQHRAQKAVLFRDRMVPASLAFFLETSELRSSLLP